MSATLYDAFFKHPQSRVALIGAVAYAIVCVVNFGGSAPFILTGAIRDLFMVYSVGCMVEGKCARVAWLWVIALVSTWLFGALVQWVIRKLFPVELRREYLRIKRAAMRARAAQGQDPRMPGAPIP